MEYIEIVRGSPFNLYRVEIHVPSILGVAVTKHLETVRGGSVDFLSVKIYIPCVFGIPIG